MTARLALALLFIVPAALAYPWQTVTHRWVLGVAIAVVILLFAWWRGEFATTKLARRWAIWRGNHSERTGPAASADSATVLLRIEDGPDELPVALIAGYTDRYGLRCDKVRITSRDLSGDRQNWVSLTLRAADNLAALQARSAQLPLHETADVVGRRLADQLRESGWTVEVIDSAGADAHPVPVPGTARESWRTLGDDAGFLTAYRIPVQNLPDVLAAVWTHPSQEIWTALEFGTDTAAAVCALRSAERPAAAVPVPGLASLGGRQRAVLTALDPLSAHRLHGHAPAGPDLAGQLRWPADGPAVRT
jgi:type VII secretion protein EccE